MKHLFKIQLVTTFIWIGMATVAYAQGNPSYMLFVAAFLQACITYDRFNTDKLVAQRDRLHFRLKYYEEQLSVLVKETNELKADIDAIVDARSKADQ